MLSYFEIDVIHIPTGEKIDTIYADVVDGNHEQAIADALNDILETVESDGLKMQDIKLEVHSS